MINNKNVAGKALIFTLNAYNDESRPDGIPYSLHATAVALKLGREGFDDVVIATGLLHDVLEKTPATEDVLNVEFGDKISKYVKDLTSNILLERGQRERDYVAKIKMASDDVKVISIVEKILNTEDLLRGHKIVGPEIWNMFDKDKEHKMWFDNEMLGMLKDSWKNHLIDDYERLIKQQAMLE